MILMILHLSLNKKKYLFNKLVDEKLDDLIYRYKGKFADTKFDEFDNKLVIINKIRDGKEDLAGVKKINKDLNII